MYQNRPFTQKRGNSIEWAIDSFSPFKSPGMDGVIPIMLQKTKKLIAPILGKIFQGCLRYGLIPTIWREVRFVFIPKAGKIAISAKRTIVQSA